MAKSFMDLVRLALPVRGESRKAIELARPYLSDDERKTLAYYLKIDRCFPIIERFGTTPELFEDREWPLFKSHLKDPQMHEFLETVNKAVKQRIQEEAFKAFAPHALERITHRIAPNIVGLEEEKAAAATLLFATEPFHILLIGDPGTGKTDILRSVERLAPISSFGLGSGVSGVGLSAAYKGDELTKGLLPLADGGIACIDELNLIKTKDLAALYNAMEKGFVTYDKGGKHETLPAKVRVIGTANPKEGAFIGKTAEILRKQIPFEDALLSRFHFLCVVRKPSDKEFEEITKRIVTGKGAGIPDADAAFIKAYVAHALRTEVRIENELELEVVGFIKRLKADERKFITEVGPRTVVGLVRLVKAMARADLSSTVKKKHLDHGFTLLERTLYRKEA